VYVCKIKSGHLILAKLFIVALRGKKLERKSSILLTGMEQNCTAANFKRLPCSPAMSCGERYINIHNSIIVFENMITLENSDACLS
jgi:hypothetical protein